jgi:uncharacterized membrane protein (DUF373 family)
MIASRPISSDGLASAFDAAVKRIVQYVVRALVVMMGVVVILATGELGWLILVDVLSPPVLLLELDELLDIFGFFLLILIGIELLDTIRAYLVEHVVRVEIVLEVGLIAIARKVIILDVKDYPPLTVVGIGGLILALAAASYLQRARAGRPVAERHPGA